MRQVELGPASSTRNFEEGRGARMTRMDAQTRTRRTK